MIDRFSTHRRCHLLHGNDFNHPRTASLLGRSLSTFGILRRHRLHLLATLCVLLSAISNCTQVCGDSPETSVSFQQEIRPLLSNHCFACHGPDEADRAADLRLDVADSLDPDEVLDRITSDDPYTVMPPPEANKPLQEKQIQLLKRWLENGAAYEQHWSFIPPRSHDGLDVENDSSQVASARSINLVDRWVDIGLARKGLSPNGRADRRTLIRRLSLDLTGLPPTRQEIERFLSDPSERAYEDAVERRLSSPAYGEHMARFWLDVVRFADTNGLHHDHYREMTPYRDWVIRAFNENLPFDSFITAQIAGDLIENATIDQQIASGFNRLHLIIDRGTALPEESFNRNVVDRVSAVGTAFLGLTLECAVCHDHKYDPITQTDFYQLYAFFNNFDGGPETGGRRGLDFRRGLQPPYLEFPTEPQAKRRSHLEAELKEVNASLKTLQNTIQRLDKAIAEYKSPEAASGSANDDSTRAEQTIDTAAVSNASRAAPDSSDPKSPGGAESAEPIESTGPVDEEAKDTSSESAANAKHAANQAQRTEAKAEQKKANERKQILEQELNDLILAIPATLVMKERAEIRPAHRLIRGNYDEPGELVQRDTPGFLPPLNRENSVPNRLDLARWLVAPENPLTARVAVNRIWQQLFGVGLVKTSEDFGAQGEPPSHPELLDELTIRFVQSGWDVKQLIRDIVLSQAYQRSSVGTPESFSTDPDNRWLARGSRYRLDAEVIRDQVLATSGLLNPKLYGKSVKPPQPEGLWKIVAMPSSYPRIYEPDSGDKIFRRSLYTFWKRGLPPPQMTIFDAPTRESCTARRERTNTPLQALVLMNEQQYFTAAIHMAQSSLSQPDSDSERIQKIYEAITSKRPDDSQLSMLEDALVAFKKLYADHPEAAKDMLDSMGQSNSSDGPPTLEQKNVAAWTMLVHSLLNLDTVKTRE